MIGYVVSLVCLSVIAYVGWRLFRNRIPIVMYHRISDIPGDSLSVSPDMFERQMEYLYDSGFHTVTLEALYDNLKRGTPLPSKPIVVTFDDGYEDNYVNALPVLRRFGQTGVVFVVTNRIGAKYDWDDFPGRPDCRVMTREEIRAWQEAGMEVGSHTRNHRHLDKLSDGEIRHELEGSKRDLESVLGRSVDFLCYPYGDYDGRVKRIAEEVGYKLAVAVFKGTTVWNVELYALPRLRVSSRQSFGEFRRKVSFLHVLNIAFHNLRYRGYRKARK